jgi:hypothetical protein
MLGRVHILWEQKVHRCVVKMIILHAFSSAFRTLLDGVVWGTVHGDLVRAWRKRAFRD